MANELLDFVMSVVRDPDVAARFAADPDQAILDANLTNVTGADVHALIPMVSESMSALPTTVPTGLDGGIAEAAGNVWSSGAATAAFDAFGEHVPADVVDDVSAALISDPTVPGLAEPDVPDVAGADDASLQFDQPVFDSDMEPAAVDGVPAIEDFGDAVADVHQVDVDSGGFDIFD
ncbi:Rv0340 family IniB-related protein [Mycolicibacterium sp. ND9-15]|uniref:Rv0340 family IniB-related protein n=1 Tax=Mycolicibacterium sp. ND9-15 TaxID=3042320 RepID=UPI002DD9F49B|nr:Rv0340 family IniB-related protein [Mycolicibacterium sp. ND9-15]WSE58098.1 Rv0340 family IniB-related protein [Mycolicibacterium sp. ND9-15]